MSRLRFFTLYFIGVIKRYKLLSFSVIIFLAVTFLIWPTLTKRIFKASLSEGVVGTYTQNDLPNMVTSLISQPLVSIDQSGKPQANLVQDWEVNSDATSFTFRLKKDLFWSDGSKIKASDLDLSLPDSEVKVMDDQTFQVKLADSYSPLPTLLNKPILKKNSNIGTGPYSISRVDKDPKTKVFVTKVVLEAADSTLPKVIVRFFDSEKKAKNALYLGQVQAILGATQLEKSDKDLPFRVVSKPNFRKVVAIFYNTKDSILSDKNFRLALSYATPLVNIGTAAKTPIAPSSWAFNSELKDHVNNSDLERADLDKVKNGRDSQIVLTSTETLGAVGEKIVKKWNELGIKSSLKIESGIPQNFQSLLIEQKIPADPDQYSLWQSTQTETNVSKYISPRVDKDLEDGRKITNLDTRRNLYLDFQKVLLDDSPATFLYFPNFNVIYIKKVENQVQKILKIQYPSFGF